VRRVFGDEDGGREIGLAGDRRTEGRFDQTAGRLGAGDQLFDTARRRLGDQRPQVRFRIEGISQAETAGGRHRVVPGGHQGHDAVRQAARPSLRPMGQGGRRRGSSRGAQQGGGAPHLTGGVAQRLPDLLGNLPGERRDPLLEPVGRREQAGSPLLPRPLRPGRPGGAGGGADLAHLAGGLGGALFLEQGLGRSEDHAARAEPAARGRGLEGVVARGDVLGDGDLETSLVGGESRLADTGVEMEAGENEAGNAAGA
jgi:hypothetical protein